MANDIATILAQVPNSGVVQMPGRGFPALVIQGDSLSQMFDDLASALKGAKEARDEESYCRIFMVAEKMQKLLGVYEEVLASASLELPYAMSVGERIVHDYFGA